MKDQDLYRYRIMKSHSILVDFEGQPMRNNVPAPLEDRETWKQWTHRILGHNALNAKILIPVIPEPATQMNTLRSKAGAEVVVRMFAAMLRDTKVTKQEAVQSAVVETARKMSTYSKESLRDVVAELDADLEPSVKQFFQNILNNEQEDIEFDDLLRKLIATYNSAVHRVRQLERNMQAGLTAATTIKKMPPSK